MSNGAVSSQTAVQPGTTSAAAKQIARGATVLYSTTFFDQTGAVVQPPGATLTIEYQSPQLQEVIASIALTPPAGGQAAWTANWDSSVSGPGSVQWSVGTTVSLPRSVEDGFFVLTANGANFAGFTPTSVIAQTFYLLGF